jgi:5,5'-dehydrodivanillate O-demethylase oxygenase subunit
MNKSTAVATQLRFADLESVGPNTPSGRYLRLFWQPVARAKDLRPTQAKPIEILGEKFTLYRGESGLAYVVDYRCSHRAAPLSIGWVQGDDIRCRYHGWRFSCSGECVEQPNNERFLKNAGIRAYPTREYLGLIFAYLGEGKAPAFRQYPTFDKPGVIVTDPPELLPCNFWNRIDNDIDHIMWVHKATATRKGRHDFLVPRTVTPPQESPWGWTNIREAKGGENILRDVAPGIYYYMPNSQSFGVRTRAKGFEGRDLWDTKITWQVPVNDRAFIAFDVTHTALEGEEAYAYQASRTEQQEAEAVTRWDIAEKILAGETTIEEIPEDISGYNGFAIEDYVTQVGQGPIAGRKERLTETDAQVVITRRLWLREVSAMLEGCPLTNWDFSAIPSPLESWGSEGKDKDNKNVTRAGDRLMQA